MLRSLDPDKNFEAPKSKKFRPTADEARRFSQDELDYLDRAETDDRELTVQRAITAKQRQILEEGLGIAPKAK